LFEKNQNDVGAPLREIWVWNQVISASDAWIPGCFVVDFDAASQQPTTGNQQWTTDNIPSIL